MSINMKMRDVPLDFEIRQLLKDPQIEPVIFNLYKSRNKKGHISIFLPIAQDEFNKYAEWHNNKRVDDGSEVDFNHFYTFNDTKTIKLLAQLKVISTHMNTSEDEFTFEISIQDPVYIEKMRRWLIEKDSIISYGPITMHLVTGEAYFRDKREYFRTNHGLYRVLKELIIKPAHTLTYDEINSLYWSGNKEDYEINKIIGEIREKLGITGKNSGFLKPFDKKYMLRQTI